MTDQCSANYSVTTIAGKLLGSTATTTATATAALDEAHTLSVSSSSSSSSGLLHLISVGLWLLVAVLVVLQVVLPRRWRTPLVLGIYDLLFGWLYIVVQVIWARGDWYKLCLRGKLMWLGRVSRDKAEHFNGQWYPCLMTQRFDYPAVQYKVQQDQQPLAQYNNNNNNSKTIPPPRVDPADIAEVERGFANHFGAEDALLFVSGFVCNVEILRAIGSQAAQQGQDLVFLSDGNCHRSLIEGFRGYRHQPFPHNDMKALEKMVHQELQANPDAIVWLIVESPYSMEGDVIDTAKVLNIRNKYPDNVRLYIDAAHSLAVEQEWNDFDIRVLSLSKCAGLFGGVMLGPKQLANWIREHGKQERRNYPQRSIAPVREFIQMLRDGVIAKRAEKVHDLALFAYDTLVQNGWHVRSPRGAYILCVQVGTPFVVGSMQQWCLRNGVYLAMIGYPGIPWKHYLGFRIMITAALTKSDVQRVVDTMHAFLSPFTFADVVSNFFNPMSWGFREPNTGVSNEPPRRYWGECAARLLGGNSTEQLHLERTLATKYGFDRCSVCSDSEFGLRDWHKLIPNTVKVVASLDDVRNNASEDAVMTPIQPFGLALFCKESVWKEEFWLRQKMLLHSTASPSYVFEHLLSAPIDTTKLVDEDDPSLIESE